MACCGSSDPLVLLRLSPITGSNPTRIFKCRLTVRPLYAADRDTVLKKQWPTARLRAETATPGKLPCVSLFQLGLRFFRAFKSARLSSVGEAVEGLRNYWPNMRSCSVRMHISITMLTPAPNAVAPLQNPRHPTAPRRFSRRLQWLHRPLRPDATNYETRPQYLSVPEPR